MTKYTIGVATIDGGKEVDCTQAEIDDIEARKASRAKQVEDLKATQYQRDRKAEYPSLESVTVAMAEKLEGNSAMWDEITKQRQAVKAKFAKE